MNLVQNLLKKQILNVLNKRLKDSNIETPVLTIYCDCVNGNNKIVIEGYKTPELTEGENSIVLGLIKTKVEKTLKEGETLKGIIVNIYLHVEQIEFVVGKEFNNEFTTDKFLF